MRSTFSLFQNHLELAHHFWLELLKKPGTIIDATLGNGHDALFLASHLREDNHLFCYDIQKKAINSASALLKNSLSPQQQQRVHLIHASHEALTHSECRLIVYNLGYLPGGDKNLTTQVETTLQSIKSAMPLLLPGGALSITCYPGHPEGALEEEALLKFVSTLSPKTWSVSYMQWKNRKQSPTWLFVQAAKAPPS